MRNKKGEAESSSTEKEKKEKKEEKEERRRRRREGEGGRRVAPGADSDAELRLGVCRHEVGFLYSLLFVFSPSLFSNFANLVPRGWKLDFENNDVLVNLMIGFCSINDY